MVYVPVPKDLSKVKTKVALNLTKRRSGKGYRHSYYVGKPCFAKLTQKKNAVISKDYNASSIPI